jgi:hypothetical protein
MAKDADELQDMRGKLQNVIDAFTVRGPFKVYEVGAKALWMHSQVSSLLRSELAALESGRDVNYVRDMASSILKLQIQETGESSVHLPVCFKQLIFLAQNVRSGMPTSVSLNFIAY